MQTYIYTIKNKGLSNSGFTSKSNKWILFSELEKTKFETENSLPYGSFRQGTFVKFNY